MGLHPVEVPKRDVGCGGGETERAPGFGAGMRRPAAGRVFGAHRAAAVNEQMDCEIALLLIKPDKKTISAAIQCPVNLPGVIARGKLAVIGEVRPGSAACGKPAARLAGGVSPPAAQVKTGQGGKEFRAEKRSGARARLRAGRVCNGQAERPHHHDWGTETLSPGWSFGSSAGLRRSSRALNFMVRPSRERVISFWLANSLNPPHAAMTPMRVRSGV